MNMGTGNMHLGVQDYDPFGKAISATKVGNGLKLRQLLERIEQNGGVPTKLLASMRHQARAAQLGYSIADVHIDSYLSNFTVSYRAEEELIADEVAPVVPVSSASDSFIIHSREDANKVVDSQVSAYGLPGAIDQSMSSGSYKVTPRALWQSVSNDLIAAADSPLDLLGEAANNVRGATDKSREYRVATVVKTSANYAAALTSALSGTTRWDVGPATSTANPISDMLLALDKPAVRPNVVIIPQAVWTALSIHPKVVGVSLGVSNNSIAVATKQQLADVLRVDKVLVPNAKYRTTKDGATATYGEMWGKCVAMLRVSKSAGPNTQSFMKTFRHVPYTFTTIMDDKPGMTGVTWVKQAHSDDEKVTGVDFGYLLDTVIS